MHFLHIPCNSRVQIRKNRVKLNTVSRYVSENKLVLRFAKKVKRLRKEKNLTQEQLSIEADIPVRSIKRIENAEVITSIAHAYRLAKGLGITLPELFDFEE